jgi:hypothetical protein
MSGTYPFDPDLGVTVMEPESSRSGSWVGAPSAYRRDGLTYLSYRRRRPLGEGRGYATYLAVSKDGSSFSEMWEVGKEALGTSSIERCALVDGGDGLLLYLSYVDPEDHRWCIDTVTAETPEDLEKAVPKRVPTLRAAPLGLEAVKDPVVLRAGGLYWMYVSCAARTPAAEKMSDAELHASDDVYTTGVVVSETGLAVSRDGFNYEWLGTVLGVHEGAWDAYAARVSCILRLPAVTLAFYDGGADVDQNYEEKTGAAVCNGPASLTRLSRSAPWLVSSKGTGSLRYMSTLSFDGKVGFYYEWARPDGSHELRYSVEEASALGAGEAPTDD